jgi:dihydroorotate dehydrogenase (NAD+) catalytic subunit
MSKYDLILDTPLMNAAGILGYIPDPHAGLDFSRLGAFVTHPVSLKPRTPAHGQRCLAYPGGILVHTGYPNPGLRAVLRRYAARWRSARLPVIVHLLAQHPGEIAAALAMLEGLEGVHGVEVGLPPGSSRELAVEMALAARGELPVVVRIALDQAAELAGPVAECGVAAISLGAPRGALPGEGGALLHGRLYGPGIFPQALAVVQVLADQGIAVIGAGGIYSPAQVEAMLAAGARAVQLDTWLWRGTT